MSAEHDASAWDPEAMPPARDQAELVLLSNHSMSARRRPVAVVLLWAWQTAAALLVAWPVASGVSAMYGAHPLGDGALWQPGGLALMDLLADARAARAALSTLFVLVFVLTGFAELVPLGAVIASLAYVTRDRKPPPLGAVIARGAAAFPTFAALFGASLVVEGAIVAIGIAIAVAISSGSAAKLGEARADQLAWLVALLFLALAAVVGVLHDLARAAAIRFRVRFFRSWRFALNTMARGPASLLWSWAWRGLAGWAPVAIGALVAARLGGRGGIALFALTLVHQGVLLARVGLRASWLAKALRAVDHAHRVIRKG